MIDQIRGLCFSGHHLTRDVIGNVAPLTAFTALVIAFSAPAQVAAAALFKGYLFQAGFWTFVLALVVYLTGGWFIGSVVAFTGNFIHRHLSHVPWYGRKLSYAYWYKQNSAEIKELYSKLFDGYMYFETGAAVSPTDRINILKQYFRKYNPDGYAEAYRQFMKVDVVRAAMFYSIAVLIYKCILS